MATPKPTPKPTPEATAAPDAPRPRRRPGPDRAVPATRRADPGRIDAGRGRSASTRPQRQPVSGGDAGPARRRAADAVNPLRVESAAAADRGLFETVLGSLLGFFLG